MILLDLRGHEPQVIDQYLFDISCHIRNVKSSKKFMRIYLNTTPSALNVKHEQNIRKQFYGDHIQCEELTVFIFKKCVGRGVHRKPS